ncbi:hypothetical protein Leryth_015450 [Lithospermum erythrorhizon]|nr:hypothetical protein Leryth_015450 [Lithospermum erythrorhizon]
MRFSVGTDDDVDDFAEGSNSQPPPPKKPKIQLSTPITSSTISHDNNNNNNLSHDIIIREKKDEYDHVNNLIDTKDYTEKDDNPLVWVSLTDPDVLDCPVCRESLTTPVFQCENGHVACASCCIKINNKCPCCAFPIGYNRCRAIEKVIESVRISCENFGFGCKERIIYSQKYEHENACIYAPCACPIGNCNFEGPVKSLYAHLNGFHANSEDHFQFNCPFTVCLGRDQGNLVIQEQADGTIFILNHSYEFIGHAFDVVCVGSSPSKKRFYYDILVCDGDSKLKLQSSVGAISNAKNCTHRKRLLVPNDFIGSSNFIKLELCIWRDSNPNIS